MLAEPRGAADDADLREQPYLPGPPALPADGTHLAYLDVWQREVTHLEAPDLVEPAVGVDTTARTQTVWQVRLHPLDGAGVDLRHARRRHPGLERGHRAVRRAAHRRARSRSTTTTTPARCRRPAATGGWSTRRTASRCTTAAQPGTATFKWSRDNGSVVEPGARGAPGRHGRAPGLARQGRRARLPRRRLGRDHSTTTASSTGSPASCGASRCTTRTARVAFAAAAARRPAARRRRGRAAAPADAALGPEGPGQGRRRAAPSTTSTRPARPARSRCPPSATDRSGARARPRRRVLVDRRGLPHRRPLDRSRRARQTRLGAQSGATRSRRRAAARHPPPLRAARRAHRSRRARRTAARSWPEPGDEGGGAATARSCVTPESHAMRRALTIQDAVDRRSERAAAPCASPSGCTASRAGWRRWGCSLRVRGQGPRSIVVASASDGFIVTEERIRDHRRPHRSRIERLCRRARHDQSPQPSSGCVRWCYAQECLAHGRRAAPGQPCSRPCATTSSPRPQASVTGDDDDDQRPCLCSSPAFAVPATISWIWARLRRCGSTEPRRLTSQTGWRPTPSCTPLRVGGA